VFRILDSIDISAVFIRGDFVEHVLKRTLINRKRSLFYVIPPP